MNRLMLFSMLLAAAPVFANGVQPDRYQVRFEADADTVQVRACFAGPVPKRLYHNSAASRFSGGITYPGGRLALRTNARC